MFTNHFNLTAQPFAERTPLEQLQKDDRITQGLARLEYLTQAGSIAVVTGQTGVGKSTLIKLFFASLSRNRFHPVYLHITHVSAVGLLKLIVRSLDEAPKRGKENLFLQILDKAQASESTTILIVDEGHLAEPQALIDLRLLISSALDDKPPLKLILTGQDSLWNVLRRSSHADFVQRITVRYHLLPLTRDQTAAYIDFQMRAAGGSEKIFEPECKSLIHDYAGGVPRVINSVATACLLNAAAKNVQKINEPLVNETLGEFHLP
jgi:general secretion pathway protein A